MRKSNNIFLFFLLIFSLYCSLTLGRSWDEDFQLFQGKVAMDYLLSLGTVDTDYLYRKYYATMYWSFGYLVTEIFPQEYKIQVNHVFNLIFSLSAIIATGKICKILFNRQVGQIVFILLFFLPIYFGHMSFNGKDTVIVFSHVWIFYLVFRYLKNQNNREKVKTYILSLGLLTSIATSIHLTFLATLIPIFLFVFIEVFLLKKFLCYNFSKIKLFIDFFKVFLIFYFSLVLFWLDTHSNIFVLPFEYFVDHFKLVEGDVWRGWPFNLINGKYYISTDVTKFHILINLLYKSPEYILFLYPIFFVLLLIKKDFFENKFNFFYIKVFFISSIIFYPILISFLVPLTIYDGLRHFLWILPYFCIIPGLAIYFFIKNFNFMYSKIISIILLMFFTYFLYNFLLITPYQYTYLNSFSGNVENKYKKFENDYWATSMHELIKKSTFNENNITKFSTCGVPAGLAKDYFEKKGYYNFTFTHPEDSEYVIMTNRVTTIGKNYTDNVDKLTNCFDKFKGDDVFVVKKGKTLLSTIRKIKR